LDDIVEALGVSSDAESMPEMIKAYAVGILSKLAAGKVTYEKAMAALKFN
jgi:hypothetical protein